MSGKNDVTLRLGVEGGDLARQEIRRTAAEMAVLAKEAASAKRSLSALDRLQAAPASPAIAAQASRVRAEAQVAQTMQAAAYQTRRVLPGYNLPGGVPGRNYAAGAGASGFAPAQAIGRAVDVVAPRTSRVRYARDRDTGAVNPYWVVNRDTPVGTATARRGDRVVVDPTGGAAIVDRYDFEARFRVQRFRQQRAAAELRASQAAAAAGGVGDLALRGARDLRPDAQTGADFDRAVQAYRNDPEGYRAAAKDAASRRLYSRNGKLKAPRRAGAYAGLVLLRDMAVIKKNKAELDRLDRYARWAEKNPEAFAEDQEWRQRDPEGWERARLRGRTGLGRRALTAEGGIPAGDLLKSGRNGGGMLGGLGLRGTGRELTEAEKRMDAVRLAASKLAGAGEAAGRGLKVVGAQAQGAAIQGLDRFAQRAGPVGGALRVFGPAGLAAAAGLGAAALAWRSVLKVAGEAMREFAKVGRAAEDLGVSTDTFQTLDAAAAQAGTSAQALGGALSALRQRSEEAATGQGTLYEALRALAPEQAEQLRLADTQDERLRAVSKAYAEAGNETDRARIAQAAFGSEAKAAERVLAQMGGGLDEASDRYRAMGQVIEESVIAKAQEMEARLAAAGRTIDLSVKRAFVDFGGVLVTSKERLAELTVEALDFLDALRAIEDRSSGTVQRKVDDLEGRIERLNRIAAEGGTAEDQKDARQSGDLLGSAFGGPSEQARRRLVTLGAELASLRFELDKRRASDRRDTLNESEDDETKPDAGGRGPDYEGQLAQLRAELEDFSLLIEAKRQELEAVQAATKGLTDEEVGRLLDEYTQGLLASTEAAKAAQSVIESVRAPLDAYNERLAELTRLHDAGRISAEVHAAAVDLARQAYENAEPAYRTAAEIAEKYATAAQKVAAEQERVNAAVAAGGLDASLAARYMADYARSVEDSAVKIALAREEQRIWDDLMSQQINSIEDFGQAFLRMIQTIIIEAIRAQAALGPQGLGSFLKGIFNQLGGLFGGGGSSGPDYSPGAVTVSPLDPVGHTGGLVMPGRIGTNPSVSGPLRPGEMRARLKIGERVLTAADNRALLDAVTRLAANPQPVLIGGGGGGGAVNVKVVRDDRTAVEVQEGPAGADGQRELRIMVRQAVGEELARGGHDRALGSRYGAAPVAKRR